MAEQPQPQVSSSDTTPPETPGLLGERVEGHKLHTVDPEYREAFNKHFGGDTVASGTAHTPEPGTKCDGCGRTVPHPKKPSSPTSKTRAYKVPLDELDAHNEVLDAAAEHIGAKGLPFAHFKTVTAALAVLLQDEGARGLHG